MKPKRVPALCCCKFMAFTKSLDFSASVSISRKCGHYIDSESPSMVVQAVQSPTLEDAIHNWCCSAQPVQPSTAILLTSALFVSEVLL